MVASTSQSAVLPVRISSFRGSVTVKRGPTVRGADRAGNAESPAERVHVVAAPIEPSAPELLFSLHIFTSPVSASLPLREQVCGLSLAAPKFNAEKLSVEFLPGEASSLRRRYTLTHNDLTGELMLSVGSDYNTDQVSGWCVLPKLSPRRSVLLSLPKGAAVAPKCEC